MPIAFGVLVVAVVAIAVIVSISQEEAAVPVVVERDVVREVPVEQEAVIEIPTERIFSTPATIPASAAAPAAWSGTHSIITTGAEFDIGTGILFWSIASGQTGYFYTGEAFTSPDATIASVTSKATCNDFSSGYDGVRQVSDLSNVANLTYSDETVFFGSKEGGCNDGLLVFKQGDQYGVIDFIRINSDDSITIEYWVGDPGVTDFSGAPTN